MPPRSARAYLLDMQRAYEALSTFTTDRALDDYLGDLQLRSAVERQFEIAGEALGQLLKLRPDMVDRFTDCRRIITFRNRLVHAYASTSDEVVWGIVQSNLPVLTEEVRVALLDHSEERSVEDDPSAPDERESERVTGR